MAKQYFTNFTKSKGLLYLLAASYVILGCTVSILEPLISLGFTCDIENKYNTNDNNNNNINNNNTSYSFDENYIANNYQRRQFENPGYVENYDPCYNKPKLELLFLSRQQCSFGRRIFFSIIFGGLIGWERRQADRPAGIRTMSLVSLGSCLFSICSAYAFLGGPENWDASRISAAIPSGVGFLGAGLIWKQTEKDEKGEFTHSVHGLTTAASLWLSAGVGIACGGELYFAASFSICCMMVLLRFGPRASDYDEEDDHVARLFDSSDGNVGRYKDRKSNEANEASYASIDPEFQSLRPLTSPARRRFHNSVPSLRE